MNFILLYQKCVVPLPVVRLRLKVSLCSRPAFVSIQRRGFPCRSSYLTFLFASVSHLSGKKCFALQMRLEVCQKFRVIPVEAAEVCQCKITSRNSAFLPTGLYIFPHDNTKQERFFFLFVFFTFLNQTATCRSYHAEKSYV